MEAYYSVDKGIGYSLARTIIHSCDFSSASYTYIDEGDAELKTFNIDHDKTISTCHLQKKPLKRPEVN